MLTASTASNYSEFKQRALEIYQDLPVARYTSVAERLRIPRDIVEHWARTEGWVNIRADHQAAKLRQAAEKLRKAIDGEPHDLPIQLFRISKKLLDRAEELLALPATEPAALLNLACVVRTIDNVYHRIKGEVC